MFWQARIDACIAAMTSNTKTQKSLIREENKLALQAHKLKNTTSASKEDCVKWLQIHIMRLGKQLSTKFKNKLTAADRVLVNIRMMSIMHHVKHARVLYLQMDLLPSKEKLQSSGSSGEGVGKFSAFWSFISELFNNEADFTSPFPVDHIPQICTLLKHLGGPTKIFLPPTRYAGGLFAGLGLLSASKPVGFIEGFFDGQKLADIWSDCLKVYRIFEGNFATSGSNGSNPRYHFVYPGTKMAWDDVDCARCFSAIKRWDSIAVHEFLELHPDFLSHFKCEIAGGVGGIMPSPVSSTPDQSISISKSKKSALRSEGLLTAQADFAAKIAIAIAEKQEPSLKTAHTKELLEVTATLRELIAAADDEDELIIAHYKKRKIELKTLILNLPP